MHLRVAGAQLPVTNDVGRNVAALRRAIASAAAEGAEILLTPEGSLSGYTPRFDRAAVADGLKSVRESASAAGLALALGTCFVEEDGRTYNQVRFYDAEGRFLGFHAKVLRCGTPGDPPEGEINEYAEAPLRTFEIGGVCVGALICNDLWANPGCTPMDDPPLVRRLAGLGARVIFHAVNGGRDGTPWARDVVWHYHRTNLQMRARAARVWIVTCDNCAPLHLPCSAPSGVVDPEGRWRVRSPSQGEHLFVHTLNLVPR